MDLSHPDITGYTRLSYTDTVRVIGRGRELGPVGVWFGLRCGKLMRIAGGRGRGTSDDGMDG